MSPEYSKIPELTMYTILQYVNHGVPVGDFLTGVLKNDLMHAIGYADQYNIRALREIALYIHNHTPGTCNGSEENIEAWIKAGGISGRAATG